MMTTYKTVYGGETIEVSADFSQAACQVFGVSGGRQVADFRHRPVLAIRAAVEEFAESCGEDLDDEDVQNAITAAVAAMTEVENDELEV